MAKQVGEQLELGARQGTAGRPGAPAGEQVRLDLLAAAASSSSVWRDTRSCARTRATSSAIEKGLTR